MSVSFTINAIVVIRDEHALLSTKKVRKRYLPSLLSTADTLPTICAYLTTAGRSNLPYGLTDSHRILNRLELRFKSRFAAVFESLIISVGKVARLWK